MFEIVAGSGTITTLASFNRANGAAPASPVVFDVSGNLFGTTSAGGTRGLGTAFEIAAASGAITTLASFNGFDGSSPSGNLVLDANGNLFGTALARGTAGSGTVFEIASGSNAITVVGAFAGANGSHPQGLVSDANGILYGVTQGGGGNGFGTVFRVASSTAGNPGIINASIVSTNLPDTVTSGSIQVEDTLVNVSVVDQAAETGTFTATLYASASGAFDSSAVPISYGLLGTSSVANVPFGIVIHVVSIPPALAPGSYTLFAQVTDPTGNTGVSAAGPSLNVIAPTVSLRPTFRSVSLPASLLSGAKANAFASLQLINVGNSNSVGAMQLALYFSPTGQVSDGTLITTAGTSQIVVPGGAINLRVPIKMIPTGLDGNYQLVAQVTDPYGNATVAVSSQTFAITPATVTLSASIDAFKPATIPLNRETPGTLTLTLQNTGNIAVGGPLEIELSLVGQNGAPTFLLDRISSPAVLNPGATRRLVLHFTTTSLTPDEAGSYLPGVLVTAVGTPFNTSAVGTMIVSVG